MRKKTIIIRFISVCFLAWFCLNIRGKQRTKYRHFLPRIKPKVVWNFVADFSNSATLNPRIKSWQLLGEENARDLHTWRYSVLSYESMFGESIFGPNENRGTVAVEMVIPSIHFTIEEKYLTLSFRRMLIIENSTKMNFKHFEQDGTFGTLFEQEVEMNCPLVLAYLCIYETDRNREDFMVNLQNTFKR